MTPVGQKIVLLTTWHLWSPKNPFEKSKNPFEKPENPQEPLDLLATVGQSFVCVNVSVLMSVCVCGVKNNVVTLKSQNNLYKITISWLNSPVLLRNFISIGSTNTSLFVFTLLSPAASTNSGSFIKRGLNFYSNSQFIYV